MSVFDLIILAILAALTLRGIWKGMVSQIVSVASFFVCWIVATRFGSLVAPTIPLESPWDQVAAMGVLFFITLIAIRFAYAALEKLIKHWHLEKLNKLLGGLLGFTKGLLLCLIITFFSVMLSETSRAVVFNSQSGSHLVQLITHISLFVPKDSYEFVHTQFAQFQSKVDEVVPGQAPETVPVQSSETVRQMLAQVQGTAKKTETGSLLTALSKWWNGSKEDAKEDATESETLTPASQTAQKSEPKVPQAVRYTAPSQPSPSSVLPDNVFANIPQPAAPKPAVVVEDFFVRQTPVSSQTQPLPALPSVPEIPAPQSSPLSPLTSLAPLSNLPILPEPTQLLPMLPPSRHVGSDSLLRNSGQTANPNSARVFQSP